MKKLSLTLMALVLSILMVWSTACADSYNVDLYQPDTAIASAPIILQRADSEHTDYTGAARRPSALIVDVRLDASGVLTAYDGGAALGSMDEIYRANEGLVNFGVRVHDEAAAAALADYVKANQLDNLWLIASDVSLIRTVRAKSELVRGIVDVTAGLPDERTLYDLVYGNEVRSVLISAADATPATVRRLQECDYMVYVDGGASDAVAAYDLVVSGVNGILTDEGELLLDTIESFEDYTLTRLATVTGHRGEYTYPNNSLEAFIYAADNGATWIELDTWLTKDEYVVLSHDNNMADTQQVAEGERDRKLTLAKWEGTIDQLTFAGTPYHYITLDQLFEATAERYPNLLYRIEIKDYRPKNVNAVMECIEKYGLRERCQIICFEEAVTTMARKRGYAVHFLSSPGSYVGTNDLAGAIRNLESIYRPLASQWVSTWSNIDVALLEYMQHYGMSAQPWPTSTENDVHGHVIEGYNNLTTDYCHWTSEYIKYVEAELTEDGKISVTAHLFNGTTRNMDPWAEIVVLDGNVAVDGLNVQGPGTVAARVRITLTTDYAQDWYYMYTQSVTVGE